MARRFRDRLSSPCHAAARGELSTGERGLWCGACEREVIDLTRLTRKQALPVLRSREPVCIRVRLDAEGEPVFVPEIERGPRGWIVAAALAAGCTAPASAPAPPPAASASTERVAMEPTTLPVGFATDELSPELIAQWRAGSEPEPVKRARPGPRITSIRARPQPPPPYV
ncbi:MAG: hypothetical protein IT378_08540, partial [Sandaracinaceae bacterium]|nr:hypothetical protein [Sandaracinaceae bacterium]